MTATRLAKATTVVALAAGWVVAGVFLWRTTVPASLRLPHVDPHRSWSDSILHRAASFDGFLRCNWVLATLVPVAALVVLVRLPPRLAGAGERDPVGRGEPVGMAATRVPCALAL